MQWYLSKCFNKMSNIYSKYHYAKNHVGGDEERTTLKQQLKVMIDRSQSQYFISTEVYINTPYGDKCPRGLIWSTSKDTCQVEKIN